LPLPLLLMKASVHDEEDDGDADAADAGDWGKNACAWCCIITSDKARSLSKKAADQVIVSTLQVL